MLNSFLKQSINLNQDIKNRLVVLLDNNNQNFSTEINAYLPTNTYSLPIQDMIPFLTIQDNLLLGIKKKNSETVLYFIRKYSQKFKLPSSILTEFAKDVSKNQQMVLQIMRAIALKQSILINQLANYVVSNKFIEDLLPVLHYFVAKEQTTILIVTSSKELLQSPYYDQCIFLS
ncbi:hypothetical protein ACWOAH_01130 [Vagococcus vulneris]|uniref:ABC transporter domain-containing protein n=1 Tax=Vagococcus vulneris TaxID=1977869 RepID=A0A430A247_9ENTE|nr:hypothetical protein [Vagococcus vulneris]RSU00510.1 hypothetical protein CBF37_00410 [Vagococcus vulneris]